MRQVSRDLNFHFTSIRNIIKKYKENGDTLDYLKIAPDVDLSELKEEFVQFGLTKEIYDTHLDKLAKKYRR